MAGHSQRVRTVVVTGASAGVGRATALEFARRGANVALIARDADALDTVADELRSHDVQALPIALDVSDADAIERAAARVEDELGLIEVWVNNAMVTVFAPVESMTPAEFARVTNVTYLGFVWGTMAAVKRMTARNHGAIVQVGSALAYRSIPLQSAYCGAKHAIRGFTDALRCELLHRKSPVHVTMVQMPALNTPQFGWADNHMPHVARPVAPIFQPEVAARAMYGPRRIGVARWRSVCRRSRRSSRTNSCRDGSIITSGAPAIVRSRVIARASDAPSNLWQPVARLHRTHGRFDDEAMGTSPALWFTMHHNAVPGSLAVCGAVGAWLVCRRRR